MTSIIIHFRFVKSGEKKKSENYKEKTKKNLTKEGREVI